MSTPGMFNHAVTRLVGLVPTLLMLITIAFFMIRIAPGGPFDSEKALPPEIRANLEDFRARGAFNTAHANACAVRSRARGALRGRPFGTVHARQPLRHLRGERRSLCRV